MIAALAVGFAALSFYPAPAAAKSCTELRALCWTMRTNKSDCAKPYQRCRQTGVFVTPLGRRFPATSRN